MNSDGILPCYQEVARFILATVKWDRILLVPKASLAALMQPFQVNCKRFEKLLKRFEKCGPKWHILAKPN